MDAGAPPYARQRFVCMTVHDSPTWLERAMPPMQELREVMLNIACVL